MVQVIVYNTRASFGINLFICIKHDIHKYYYLSGVEGGGGGLHLKSEILTSKKKGVLRLCYCQTHPKQFLTSKTNKQKNHVITNLWGKG